MNSMDADGVDNKHSRTYQACIPCRRRKIKYRTLHYAIVDHYQVRCDLGPVDNPHDPPCVRCRREAKECFFSATRRKKRAADSGTTGDDIEPNDYEIRGGRKRLKEGVAESVDSDAHSVHSPAPVTVNAPYIPRPLTPGGSMGRQQPLRRPHSTSQTPYPHDEADDHVNSHTAALLQTAELHNGHDALNVLIEAATANHRTTGSASDAHKYASSLPSPAELPMPSTSKPLPPDSAIDPAIMQQPPSTARPSSSADYASAYAAWSRFRFIRNGWFTIKEGMDYIEYFYTYMSPLTPIALPDYRGPDKHAALLENEPMLAVTMLMIASRYMTLSGPGAQSRSHSIHSRLWPFVQRMIDRIVWGRELSGTTLHPDETQPGCDVNPLSRKGLLTLGTVESLLLLTEWHPRMMHFPADEDDTQLMAPVDPMASINESTSSPDKGQGGHALTSWLEPCFRSDRMCWILLNMAMTVASQIGVFDPDCSRHLQTIPPDQQEIYQRRRLHVKSVILGYITQTSGRMGVTAMLPQGYAEPSLSELYNPKRSSFKDTKDIVLHFWLRLATLVKINNEELYANRQQTRDIIKTGKYRELLQRIKPSLVQWRREFEAYRNIPILLRHVLIIEYEHTRVILHQLALQAVVERCANNNTGAAGKIIPPNVLDQWFGSDRQHVDEVMQACRNVLRVVVDGLAPGGYLKHAPVRTFFRIVSVTLVLVKTFAFGAFENEMALSLNLMDRTVEVMRNHVVDDVHLSNRFSNFLEVITNRLRPMIVRMSRTSGSGNATTSRVSSHPASPGSQHQNRSTEHMPAYPVNPYDTCTANAEGNGANALYGISTQTYNLSDKDNTFSIMPPPAQPPSPSSSVLQQSYPMADGNFDYAAFGSAFGQEDGYDWLALPLDPILQAGGGDVTANSFGPGIGDFDMLEVLLGGGGGQGGGMMGGGHGHGHL
ncbi:hypothetical protein E4T38_07951 [Aureobasidium subglaciale]|nr:hypothetical protein E4T38_07951 [Aureobasidium subglaciale]KAI5216460.1 hypothetical protein E4T40_07961 [Aureobasidium subglaciale]KAI5219643.1 hypothetical protein E4T41_07869 [Aureobasidium subglaciale]KAI5257646.1 hypothetical protein E4T46_07852 [Aureobasidium subglaciale]